MSHEQFQQSPSSESKKYDSVSPASSRHREYPCRIAASTLHPTPVELSIHRLSAAALVPSAEGMIVAVL